MIKKEIIASMRNETTWVALLENGVPVELYIEPAQEFCLVGSVFKGRVENVLPGIEAAFVDIGLDRNAFLYVNDVLPLQPQGKRHPSIKELIRPGQEIMVQVAKDPLGSKGPRVTMRVNLPGRFTVLMPTVNHLGISRRIEDEEERERLRALINRIKPDGMGIIVRTAARGVDGETLKEDIDLLCSLWRDIQAKASTVSAPSTLYRERSLLARTIRDLFTEEVDRMVVDSEAYHRKVINMLDGVDAGLEKRVVLEKRADLFEYYGVNQEISKALERRVWLRCGGYLIFDQTEALTVIDVNTGKYTGRIDLEDTVFKTNIDAAVEIVRQLRLRNLGGIIIIDFIDMSTEEHRNKVLEVLAEEIKKDRRRTHIMGLTQLGLVELTRKKVHPSLSELLMTTCPRCGGAGRVALVDEP
ncbi:MAG: Rne/Rng family ribonuclease [Peptococcaceae bacterium]|nr:Rne/Rng family ribonuclease [Peptococcaceae bacterium]